MKPIAQIIVLVLGSFAAVFAQTAASQPESLGDAARALKSENKSKPAAAFSNDSELLRKPLIPDVTAIGLDNVDEIMKSIDDYRSSHNLEETEAAVHDWYSRQVSLLTNAIQENQRIERRDHQEARGSNTSDVRPNNHDEYVNLRHIERDSRKAEQRQIKLNRRLIIRIQQDFTQIRPQMQDKYGMKVDWFTICEDAGCTY
jgi:hypothetical protein